ncbi:MAG: hypothetical protein R3B84_00055 [Zavarzinella sp.]
MKKWIFVALLGVLGLMMSPGQSFAQYPYQSHGFNFLERLATSKFRWIHMDGPLFNYGPYDAPGSMRMHIPRPIYGDYSPANQQLWGPAQGYPGAQQGYPGMYPGTYSGYPATTTGQPVIAPAAPAAPGTTPAPTIVPSAYQQYTNPYYGTVYPSWMYRR